MKERRSGDGAQLSSRSAVSVFILEHDPVIDAGLLSSLAGWTDQECERMRNFRHAGALSSYCLARVLARKAISPLSGMREEEILFSEGAQGKPFLEGAPAMRFNWSHASGCVALALSRDAELGIDIEARGRGDADEREIARRFFSKDEADWIEAGGQWGLRERFLSIFVQKESFLKMTGEGLSGSLEKAEALLSLPPRRSARSVLVYAGSSAGYIAAIRVSGTRPARFSFRSARFGPDSVFPGLEDFRSVMPLPALSGD
jgi:phosphopantetheinyl transferase